MPDVLQLLHSIGVVLSEEVEDVLDIVDALEEEGDEHPLLLALLSHNDQLFRELL